MNLLTETEEVLENHKLKPGDVNWVGSRDGKYSVSWAVFRKLANKEYNEGYGGAKSSNGSGGSRRRLVDGAS